MQYEFGGKTVLNQSLTWLSRVGVRPCPGEYREDPPPRLPAPRWLPFTMFVTVDATDVTADATSFSKAPHSSQSVGGAVCPAYAKTVCWFSAKASPTFALFNCLMLLPKFAQRDCELPTVRLNDGDFGRCECFYWIKLS